jgi:hypothetical protein
MWGTEPEPGRLERPVIAQAAPQPPPAGHPGSEPQLLRQEFRWDAGVEDEQCRIAPCGYPAAYGTDPDKLAVTLLAALQGGLLLAQVQRDTRSLETAVDTLLELARISRQDAPADGEIPRP